jgi:hypothetical protein
MFPLEAETDLWIKFDKSYLTPIFSFFQVFGLGRDVISHCNRGVIHFIKVVRIKSF